MLRAGAPIIGIVCCCARAASGHAAAAPPSSVMNSRRFMCGWPPPGKEKMQRAAQKSPAVMCPACSRKSGWTAGPDGVREPKPHHSSGIHVPMNRQASLGSVGSTDCAITRHYSLASFQHRPRRTKPPQPGAGIPSGAASPPRRCAPSCWPVLRLRPAAVAADAARLSTDRLWSPSIGADWRLPH
jgi:hypothetical protein